MEKLRQPKLLRLPDGHGVAGRRGLEADREEHHLAVGVLLGQLDRVQRRVDHAHVPAGRLDAQQVVLEPGTRSMSPKEVKITSGRRAMAMALSISSSGVTQTGQPGPCTSVTCCGSRRRCPT